MLAEMRFCRLLSPRIALPHMLPRASLSAIAVAIGLRHRRFPPISLCGGRASGNCCSEVSCHATFLAESTLSRKLAFVCQRQAQTAVRPGVLHSAMPCPCYSKQGSAHQHTGLERKQPNPRGHRTHRLVAEWRGWPCWSCTAVATSLWLHCYCFMFHRGHHAATVPLCSVTTQACTGAGGHGGPADRVQGRHRVGPQGASRCDHRHHRAARPRGSACAHRGHGALPHRCVHAGRIRPGRPVSMCAGPRGSWRGGVHWRGCQGRCAGRSCDPLLPGLLRCAISSPITAAPVFQYLHPLLPGLLQCAITAEPVFQRL